ncbi:MULTISPECIES: carbon-nitrogen hydrolase family protein [Thioclava]|uniref:carbon-nitrogen hydrolase family protein n=1 Tax=Thioclava TaxID=285107 RepID=UPI000C615977|nr:MULTISPECIES: carbon-nitrogen hydrolase family protein [Thioclava]MAQ37028.1 amidohydrolase [Thioclava sp.]
MSREVVIAAAAYPLDWFDDWAGYAAKVSAWVAEAAGQGAQLLVFPEYGAMELASLGGAEVAGDLEAALVHVAGLRADMEALFADLAAEHGVHILAPSGPVIDGSKRVNRASLFGSGGLIGHQDKAIMTRFEREIWHVDAGEVLVLFDTALGKIGVTICYDSEFPLLARALAEAGAEIILVPSCTDTLAGNNRVRIGAMARALENQCLTVQAPTVGDALWCPAVDENRGTAAIFAPPDGLWPESGTVAEGAPDSPGWTFATVDLGRVTQSRTAGTVLPFKHWSEQSDAAQIIRIASENPAQP